MGAMFDSLDMISRLLLEAMLNGIWQGGLIVVLVWGMLRGMRRVSATTRHAVWLVSLLAITALPLMGLIAKRSGSLPAYNRQPATAHRQPATGNRLPATDNLLPATDNLLPATGNLLPATGNRQPAIAAQQPATGDRQPATGNRQPAPEPGRVMDRFLAGRLPLALMGLWLGIAAAMIGRIVRSYASIFRLRRQLESVPGEQSARMRGLAARFGIGRRVRLFSSARISMPMTVGVLKPMILLPPELADNLSEEEFDSIIAHELAHIKRLDYATNLMQRLVEALLFFHPAVWLICKQLMIERELACDDWAVKTCEPRGYASCLARLVEHWNTSKPGTAVRFAATGILFGKHVLTRRVEMILNRDRNAETAVSKPALFYAIGVAVSFIIVCSLLSPVIAVPSGQKPSRPRKEKRDARPAAPSPGRAAEGFPPAPPAPAEAPEPPMPAIVVAGEIDWDEDLLPPLPPDAPEPMIAPMPVAPLAPEPFRGFAVAGGAAYTPSRLGTTTIAGFGQDDKKTPAIPEAELLGVLADIVKKDADPTVRQEALQGIYRMRSDAAVNTLIGLYDSQTDVKIKSEIIAYMIRRNSEDNAKAIAKLTSIAKSEQNEELRNRAIRYLGAVRGDEGANNLIQIYDSLQDQKTKMSVIRSLGGNRSRKAIDKLIQIAKNDSDPAVRQAAVRSLNGIDGRIYTGGLTVAPIPRIGQLGGPDAPFAFQLEGREWDRMRSEWEEKSREMIDKLRVEGIENFKFDGKRLDEMLRKLEIELPKIDLRLKELQDGSLNKPRGDQVSALEAQLRSHRAQLRAQLEGMRVQYAETHPKVVETRKMLQAVEKELEDAQRLSGAAAPRPAAGSRAA
ncbi:MAG: M56 family metallopeptidase, partial [Blastocatellia bacterium]